jgi:hypothetical protein
MSHDDIDEARETIRRQWADIPDQRAKDLLRLLENALDALGSVRKGPEVREGYTLVWVSNEAREALSRARDLDVNKSSVTWAREQALAEDLLARDLGVEWTLAKKNWR